MKNKVVGDDRNDAGDDHAHTSDFRSQPNFSEVLGQGNLKIEKLELAKLPDNASGFPD